MFGFWESILSFLIRTIGLRTDAADAAASLHAKVGNVTNKVNIIGTSADTRASNTVMGWLNSPIKSWQRVTANANSTTTITLSISTVNTAKCIVLVDGAVYTATLSEAALPWVSGFTSTQVTLGVYSGPANGTVSVIVVEFY